ncbi:mechanosensitive ion channel family protein [Noviherbaspirillum denitrificans]|uniref:Mechanosensitive ion channel protein MscS n=1 Tax=Noviherbaspirillum denitrificans TaxID=1968433 RepID=A0A254TAV4_9BURK|nr:mechanosensitive ion channel family protein [Noviherbaspirillum denitrificans]OWW19779.1 mechanosensitive ion channel protein MscS [Noviherbaspirillum denitrificans]
MDANEWKLMLEGAWPWLRILVIWVLAWAVLWMIRRVLRVLKTHIVGHVDAFRDSRRIETLMNVFRYTANIVIVGVAVMATLGTVGISIAPILATAGVAGIAIGFGAQSLVKDFFTGLFLLIEGQVSEGDIIEAAGKSGHVERVTLRHIRIRDYDGSVHFIPNSMITTVTNRSRDYAFAVVDLNVPRKEDLNRVFRLMDDVVRDMRADPAVGPFILEDADMAGVEKVEDAAVGIRCRIKVQPSKQWRVRREFLRRMKAAMDTVEEVQSAA